MARRWPLLAGVLAGMTFGSWLLAGAAWRSMQDRALRAEADRDECRRSLAEAVR